MRVFILAYGSSPWQNGQLIYHEAKRQGKDVQLGFIEWPFNHVLREIGNYKPDWIFLTGSRAFSPAKLSKLASLAKLAIWDADAVDAARLKTWEDLKGIPDLIFTVITDLDSSLAKEVIWFPQYYDAVYHAPTYPVSCPQLYDVIFLGGLDEKRKEWVQKLGEKYKILHADNIFGPDMSNAYRQSRIAFGIWRDEYHGGDFATSDRIYKAMGSGCFYLLQEVKNVELLFTPEVHLDTYDGSFDLLSDQIEYYLGNTKLRNKIATAGRAEVLENHTLAKRIPQYWGYLENDTSS